jgi:transcriptional regulator with XRE-family HTH domain
MKDRREALGLRREELAAKADISYDYVRKLEERGPEGPEPTLPVARRIAAALNSTVDKIFPVTESEQATR